MPHAMRKAIALLVLGLAAQPLAGFTADSTHGQDATEPAAANAGRVVYPLKVSANRRYLVDQENRPFLVVGDSPQALIGRLSVANAAFYMKNRAATASIRFG